MTPRVFNVIVAALCGYEVVAICSGRVPTLSMIDRRLKHTISPIILSGLAAHFYGRWPERHYRENLQA